MPPNGHTPNFPATFQIHPSNFSPPKPNFTHESGAEITLTEPSIVGSGRLERFPERLRMSRRGRSYSRSPSPAPSPQRRNRDDASMRRDPPSRCSLLVRNLSKDVRESELRYCAEKYGPVRDVYLPRDYYTGEPRGIGFVEYTNARDAEDAKYGMDRTLILGREVSVVFAMQGRKRPDDYRRGSRYGGGAGESGRPRKRGGGGGGRYRRRSRSRSPRRRSYSRSPRRRSHSRSPKKYKRSASRTPPRRRSYSRSRSPAAKKSYSGSPAVRKRSYSRSRSPRRNDASRSPKRASQSKSPERDGVAARSTSPKRVSPSRKRDVEMGSPRRSGSPLGIEQSPERRSG